MSLPPAVEARIKKLADLDRVKSDQREIMLAIGEIPGLAELIAKNTGSSGSFTFLEGSKSASFRSAADIRAAATCWLGVMPDAEGNGLRCACSNFVGRNHETGEALPCYTCEGRKKKENKH